MVIPASAAPDAMMPATTAPADRGRPAAAGRLGTFHPLRVARVVRETTDASSFVLDVPEALRSVFAYRAGQFCTLRLSTTAGVYERCYSMSSSPDVDDELQVTVKRVPGGAVSNWMIDELAPGMTVDTSPPSGLFQLGEGGGGGDIVAFGAGSGITPIFSILKSAMRSTSRRASLLYANQDRDSVIFAGALDALAAQHPTRLRVDHHLDVERGFVRAEHVQTMLEDATDPELYVCGPGPFMDIVEETLLGQGIDARRIHIERFAAPTSPVKGVEAPVATDPIQVTIEVDGDSRTVEHRPGTTILQTARQLGLAPPFSCESGNCATCMAHVVMGSASMRTNNALTPDEVEEGWVLTCQAVPTSPSVRVVYE